jgi:hypothetical protein
VPAVTAAITVNITFTSNPGWSASYIPLIQAAVAAAVNSYSIGSIIAYTQLFVAAYLIGTPAQGTFNIVSLQIQKNSSGFVSSNITLNYNEIPVCAASGVVVVGS